MVIFSFFEKPKLKMANHRTRVSIGFGQLRFVITVACNLELTVFAFCFSSPERRLDQPQVSGGLGEHCSSPAVGRGVCAPPGRVAQPRLLATDRGYPAGAANRGRFLLVTFLGKTRKVTSCRSTTGDVDFDFALICLLKVCIESRKYQDC
jgi:hypothetical protein